MPLFAQADPGMIVALLFGCLFWYGVFLAVRWVWRSTPEGMKNVARQGAETAAKVAINKALRKWRG